MEKDNKVIQRINNLRSMFEEYNIDAYIIPSTDEYLSEYSPLSLRRLEYISGFTGSNGYMLIGKDYINFYTDGRYIKQSSNELPSCVKILNLQDIPDSSNDDIKIGYNSAIISASQLEMLKLKNIISIDDDLVDQIWTNNRPILPNSKAFIYPIKYSGELSSNKIQLIQTQLINLGLDYHLVTDLTSIGWVLNIRGRDIPYCPLLLSRLIISREKLFLFVDKTKITKIVEDFLPNNIEIFEEERLYNFLSEISGTISCDTKLVPLKYIEILKKQSKVIHMEDLCIKGKLVKNDIEIRGATNAHIIDASAVIEFLAYFDQEMKIGKKYTEYDVGELLQSFRSKNKNYIDDSFATICGFKDNGAIIHYKAQKKGSKIIEGNGLLLIDSGAHYYGGTTDITRTIAIGQPSPEHKLFYTNVLKGHIALASAKFPQGLKCMNLDILARQYLWALGKDYPHGTGHGVGNVLSVHEGPIAFNLKNERVIKPGMIFSNEPGYYVNGEYGIRIENLIYTQYSLDKNFLEFQNLTLVPYCLDLIDISLLSNIEKKYINDYHASIIQQLEEYLTSRALTWLRYNIVVI